MRGSGGGGDDDESRKYPRKVRRCTSKKADRRTSSTWKFTHTHAPSLHGSCFIALFIAANYGLLPPCASLPPVSPPQTLGRNTRRRRTPPCYWWIPPLWNISTSRHEFIAHQLDPLYLVLFMINPHWYPRDVPPVSPLKTTHSPDRPLYRFLFPPVPATSIAREYSH